MIYPMFPELCDPDLVARANQIADQYGSHLDRDSSGHLRDAVIAALQQVRQEARPTDGVWIVASADVSEHVVGLFRQRPDRDAIYAYYGPRAMYGIIKIQEAMSC